MYFPHTSWKRLTRSLGFKRRTEERADRYSQITDRIRSLRAARIMEIGTHEGSTALRMIKAAQEKNATVLFAGFDLFEDMTAELYERDPSARHRAPSLEKVRRKLAPTGADIRLFRGSSCETVPAARRELPMMDIVFIDGSHLLADIEADWRNIQPYLHERSVVFFDDYWRDGWNGDFSVGCTSLVDRLAASGTHRVEVLPITKKLPRPWGTLSIQIAAVSRR